MPKKVKYEDEEEDEEEVEDDDDDEELEQEEMRRKPGRPFGTIKKFKKPIKTKEPESKEPEPKRRYVAFAIPARVGVADAETDEVVGEGEMAVHQILADILERLERIENTLGNMVE